MREKNPAPWFLVAASLSFASVAHATPKDECINAAEAGQRSKTRKQFTAARPKLVACAADGCPAVVRDDCVKWLAEVDAGMPTIVIRGRDGSGHDVVDVRVVADGKELMPRLTGTAVAIDPGEHLFRFETAGRPPVEQTVLVAEGEKARVIQIAWSTAEARPVVAVEPPKPRPVPVEPPKPPPPPARSIAPWIIGGAGIASLAAFGILEALLQSEYSDLESGCGRTRACTDSDVSGTETKVTLAKVTLGIGIVGLAVAIPWILIDRTRQDAPRRAAYRDLLGGRF